MGSKAIYRSAIRSKEMIRAAFIQLLQEKDYTKITVTDVIKIADINRSTFYAHYPDIRGVIEAIENEIIGQMMDILKEFEFTSFFENPAPILLRTSRMLEENEEFYRILIQSNGAAIFLEKLKTLFANYLISDSTIPDEIKTSNHFALRICYFSGGIVNMYQQWFSGNLEGSLNDISLEISKLIEDSFDKRAL